MKIHYSKTGSGPALIILHGLYGTGNNWLNIGKSLSDKYTIYFVDLRNHGKSAHSQLFNYDEMALDIKELCDSLELKTIYLLGHSMGGKTAMTFTLKYPGIVEKLVVVDISPYSIIDYQSMNPQLNFHKTIIETFLTAPLDSIKSRTDADNHFQSSIPDKSIRSFLLKNLTLSKQGGYKWKLNITAIADNIEPIMDTIPPVKLGIQSFIPILFIKGEKSPYITEDDFKAIPDIFQNARFNTFKDAGHWLHAECPEEFIRIVKEFFQTN